MQERVKHYSEIEVEAAHSAGDGQTGSEALVSTPSNWPTKGEIVFDRVDARYRPELPLVRRQRAVLSCFARCRSRLDRLIILVAGAGGRQLSGSTAGESWSGRPHRQWKVNPDADAV